MQQQGAEQELQGPQVRWLFLLLLVFMISKIVSPRLSKMGTERFLQDGILCELYEEKLQENVQTVLT